MCATPKAIFGGFSTECQLEGVSDAEIAAAAEALRRDPNVRAELRNQISELAAVRGNFGGDIAILEDALEALRAAQ